jgi:hypothetical protein
VAAAEDGNTPHHRPQAAVDEPDDAVDDAIDVWSPLFIIPQWVGSLLGDFKCYQNPYAVFRYWLGRGGFINGNQASGQG